MNNGYVNFPDIGGYNWNEDAGHGVFVNIPKNSKKGFEIKEFIDAAQTKVPVINGTLKVKIGDDVIECLLNTCCSYIKLPEVLLISLSIFSPVGLILVVLNEDDNHYIISTIVDAQ